MNLYRVLTVKIKTEIPEKTIELALFALELRGCPRDCPRDLDRACNILTLISSHRTS